MPPRTRYYILRALLAVLVGTSIGLLLHSCTPETIRQQQEATFEMPTIAFEEFELGNGLTVLLHQDNSRPLVAVGVWYRTGSSYEWRGRTGLAHLFEHLMFNGSKGYPQDYFEGLEDAGVTDINGTTNRDRTNYFQTVPKDALDRVLWLESDRMGWMLVDEERLRQQVGVVHNEKRQRESVPYGTVWAHLGKLLYGGEHPYSWPVIGFEPDLAALTMDDIQRFRSAWYMPNNAILVLAGDFDLDDARAKITSYFGPIPPGVSAPPPTAAPTPLTENRRQSIGDTVPHPRIYRSWLAPSVQNVEQTAALYLACKMLGGSERSILHRRLVLEDRLANYAVCYSNFGALSGEISLIVEPRNEADMELVESIVEETLADFLSAPPDATELHRLVQAEIGSTLRGIDKLGGFSGRLTRLAEGTALAANPRLWEEELRAIEAMDPQTLQQVATTWLQKPWAQISVLVGEEAAPPLSPYSAGGDFKPDALPELEVPVDRPPLPQLGPHSLPVLPAVEQWLITNHCDEDNPDCDPVQMPLYLIHRAGTPLVSLDLQFECMRPDDHQPAGLSDFAAHMMSQGTEAYSLIELDELSSELAATVSPYANLDYCGVSGSAPAWNMQKTLELVKELAFKPRFDEKAMVREQARWLSSIEREYSDPRNLSLRLLPPLLYGDYHPYGVPMTGTGYKVEISALVPDQLRSWHKHVFSPDRGSLIMAGDWTEERKKRLLQQLRQLFASEVEPAPVPQRVASAGCPPPRRIQVSRGPRIILVPAPGRDSQSVIATGQLLLRRSPANDMDNPVGACTRVALELANRAFGGSITARLGSSLREEKGWSYSSYSLISDPKGTPALLSFTPVQADKTADAVREIMDLARGFTDDKPLSKEEWRYVRDNLVRKLPGSLESLNSLRRLYSSAIGKGRAEEGRPPGWWAQTRMQLLRDLRLSEIRQQVERIHPDAWIIVVVGSPEKVLEPLRALDMGEVEILDLYPAEDL